MLAEFACANLAATSSAVNLLSSGVVICLLLSSILFSRTAQTVIAATLIILGILFITSFILALKVALVAKISGILSSICFILVYTSFFTTSFFTTSLSLLKSTNLSTSNLFTLFFKLLKLVGRFFNLSISNLSTLDFKLAKSVKSVKPDVSAPVAFLKSAFVA